MPLNLLLDRIREKKVTIAILGLGRVGLPLSSVLANAGFNVLGIDVDSKRLDSVRNSICPFFDPPLQENLKKSIDSGNLTVSNKIADTNVDVIILTVGTPSSQEGSVDYSQLYTALNEVCSIELSNKIIILRSTLPPKTTQDIIIPFLEHKTKFQIQFFL